jgi:hypothetical protein
MITILPQAQNDLLKTKEPASWSSDHGRLDARSSALHQLVAEKIRRDVSVVDIARANIVRWHAESGVPVESSAHAEWLDLLDGPIDQLLAVLESDDQHASRLRQSMPFSGILTLAEREAVFAAFALARSRAATRD